MVQRPREVLLKPQKSDIYLSDLFWNNIFINLDFSSFAKGLEMLPFLLGGHKKGGKGRSEEKGGRQESGRGEERQGRERGEGRRRGDGGKEEGKRRWKKRGKTDKKNSFSLSHHSIGCQKAQHVQPALQALSPVISILSQEPQRSSSGHFALQWSDPGCLTRAEEALSAQHGQQLQPCSSGLKACPELGFCKPNRMFGMSGRHSLEEAESIQQPIWVDTCPCCYNQ